MSSLPSGWLVTEIGEISHVIRGITFPASEKEETESPKNICCLRTTNIQREIDWNDVYFVPRQYVKNQNQVVKVGDILMSMANSYELVGKVAVARSLPYEAAFGAFLSVLRPKTCVDVTYLFHLLRSSDVQSAIRAGSSQTVNIANVSQGKLNGVPVNLAPIAEQKRIADKLDTLLSRVDACRERLDRVASLIKRFKQSVLAAATSGELTADWRETKQRGWEWREKTIEQIAIVGTGSTPLRSNPAFYSTTGTPWITSAATSKELVLAADEYVTQQAIAAHRLKTYPIGTLLVAMYGEGKTRGQVTELGLPATTNQACAAVVVDEKVALKGFVKLSLQGQYLEMREMATGGNQPNLNLSKIKEFSIALPRLDEQAEVLRRVNVMFGLLNRFETRLKKSQQLAARLTPALLAKAFRGELVPQDPNDEPAQKMLARFKTAKATESPKAPPRGRKLTATTQK